MHWMHEYFSQLFYCFIIIFHIYIKYTCVHRVEKDEAREPMEANEAFEKDNL